MNNTEKQQNVDWQEILKSLNDWKSMLTELKNTDFKYEEIDKVWDKYSRNKYVSDVHHYCFDIRYSKDSIAELTHKIERDTMMIAESEKSVAEYKELQKKLIQRIHYGKNYRRYIDMEEHSIIVSQDSVLVNRLRLKTIKNQVNSVVETLNKRINKIQTLIDEIEKNKGNKEFNKTYDHYKLIIEKQVEI